MKLKDLYVTEAEDGHKVGDTVHLVSRGYRGRKSYGGSGTVTKTNGFGHTYVNSEKGEKRFNKHGREMENDSTDEVRHGWTLANNEEGLAIKQAEQDARAAEKKQQEEKEAERRATMDATKAVHQRIMSDLHRVGALHGTPEEYTPSYNDVGNSATWSKELEPTSPVEKDMFSKLHHRVRIDADRQEPGRGWGRVGYSYQHHEGGGNGIDTHHVSHEKGTTHITQHKRIPKTAEERAADKYGFNDYHRRTHHTTVGPNGEMNHDVEELD